MWRKAAVTIAAALTLAACSTPGTSGGATTAPPAAPPATQAATTPAMTTAPADTSMATPEATATGVALNIDPCAVLPQAEATTLLGVAAPTGQSETLDGGGKACVYPAGTNGVVTLVVAQATSAAEASAQWDQERAQADQALQKAMNSSAQLNPTLTDVSGIGDKASTASFSATIGPVTLSGSAIYVLKGPTFFGLSVVKLNGSAPTAQQLETEAQTILGRL
jgi:hypothetical protein